MTMLTCHPGRMPCWQGGLLCASVSPGSEGGWWYRVHPAHAHTHPCRGSLHVGVLPKALPKHSLPLDCSITSTSVLAERGRGGAGLVVVRATQPCSQQAPGEQDPANAPSRCPLQHSTGSLGTRGHLLTPPPSPPQTHSGSWKPTRRARVSQGLGAAGAGRGEAPPFAVFDPAQPLPGPSEAQALGSPLWMEGRPQCLWDCKDSDSAVLAPWQVREKSPVPSCCPAPSPPPRSSLRLPRGTPSPRAWPGAPHPSWDHCRLRLFPSPWLFPEQTRTKRHEKTSDCGPALLAGRDADSWSRGDGGRGRGPQPSAAWARGSISDPRSWDAAARGPRPLLPPPQRA